MQYHTIPYHIIQSILYKPYHIKPNQTIACSMIQYLRLFHTVDYLIAILYNSFPNHKIQTTLFKTIGYQYPKEFRAQVVGMSLKLAIFRATDFGAHRDVVL